MLLNFAPHQVQHLFLKHSSLRRLATKMAVPNNAVRVQVKQGVVVGLERRLPSGALYNSFKGIPYAVPPLGELRYRSPMPLERFSTPELDCTRHGNVAHHRDALTQEIVGSEDCLFLNVYTPKTGTLNEGPLPVMVWIHGGGFFFGSGNSDYYFPLHLLDEQVVVVTMNYRLGALGFLCLPEEGVWGNAGLKDQRLALQWVQENISQFNGDPTNVTLFGESAGAACVHLHAYARHAHKLFHKIIMQSGTSNMEWVFQSNPASKARRLAAQMGCSLHDTRDILAYLQSDQVTPLGILASTLPILTPDERRRGLPLPFKPVLEDALSPDVFLDSPLLETLQRHDVLAMPTIMGYNSAEGITFIVNAVRKREEYERDFARLVPRNLPYPPEDAVVQELAQQMRKFYLGGQAISRKTLDGLKDLLTDYHFTVDMQLAAEWHVRQQPRAPLYFYRFDYVGERNMYKRIYQMEHLRGACHGEELFYLFQMAGDQATLSAEDALCVKRFCRMWANFARCGAPTPNQGHADADCIDFTWTPVQRPSGQNEPFELDYLLFDKQCQMQRNPEQERMEFWRNIYSQHTAIDYSRLSAKL